MSGSEGGLTWRGKRERQRERDADSPVVRVRILGAMAESISREKVKMDVNG